MNGALLVAFAASIGNFLQGWDNATIAVAVLYIKREFSLQSQPTMEGLIVAMSLVGATIITTFSGAASDWLGRRPMLIISSILYFAGSLVMLWSPSVYILLLARLVDGLGIGLAVTLVPIYISETSPSEIRGFLNTFPQFSGSTGMFLSYCMVFAMSLRENPNWRLMLGVLSIPSLLYFLLVIFFLPESPRWLVSKGRMLEAKQVLQRLRAREDVSVHHRAGAELAGEEAAAGGKEQMTLYGPEEGLSWVARPIAWAERPGHGVPPWQHSKPGCVVLRGSSGHALWSVHERLPEMGSMRSTLFPNFGSMFSVAEQHPKAAADQWDEESLQREGEDYPSDGDGAGDGDFEDPLRSPLLSRQTTTMEGKDLGLAPASVSGVLGMRRRSSLLHGGGGGDGEEAVGSAGIGGGWQLAWQWAEREGVDGKRKETSRRGSVVSIPGVDLPADGEFIQAAALVSQPALYSQKLLDEHPVGPAMVHPSETAAKGPMWKDLFEAGVRHALFVGIGIQILQQFAGINGVLYYTPQILEQAGVEVLFSNLGIGSDAASILISALTTLLMLPCIGVAMRLMDIAGRRRLLLSTIPVLIASLVVLVLANVLSMGTVPHAVLSTVSVVVYFCCFVMGFGPIPNILCAEIFPTRVRGVCIAICSLTFWVGDIIVTYSLPVMLNSVGLAGVFGIYAIVCAAAFVFVFLKVPETKGMPLEVIIEFFSVGARAARS
ncbi:unnamed protein product [Spirodela intermedia]|uniref:Major facilitator superfamily (MFS) profile domain-containing protein n=1 Tax=Spirodela intermedia TaxID=51605 RepID=A0A7I8J8X4_SPIIN|nr:unnamed protein product [Spirodela intermedia]CAA6666647.1 unnamed protein product [Spirodela intermedia]